MLWVNKFTFSIVYLCWNFLACMCCEPIVFIPQFNLYFCGLSCQTVSYSYLKFTKMPTHTHTDRYLHTDSGPCKTAENMKNMYRKSLNMRLSQLGPFPLPGTSNPLAHRLRWPQRPHLGGVGQCLTEFPVMVTGFFTSWLTRWSKG